MSGCICTGAVCTCGAEGVVRDGRGVRVAQTMMDSEPSARADVADRAAQSRYDNVRGLTAGGMPAENYCAMLDAEAEKDPVATAKRAAIADASRDAYEQRVTDAWRGSERPMVRDASDATGQISYEARIRDAWKGGG